MPDRAAPRRRWIPLAPGTSIESFLLWTIFAALLVVIGAEFGWEYGRAATAIDSAHDRALARVAAGYLRALHARYPDVSAIPSNVFREELGASAAPDLRFRVVDDSGATLGGDPLLRVPPSSTARQEDPAFVPVHRQRIAGAEYVVAVAHELAAGHPQPAFVLVAEPLTARTAAHRSELILIGLRGLLMVVAILALVRQAVRAALWPLTALGESIRWRGLSDLTPVALAGPRELAPLIATMNQLLLDQRESIDQQATFLADASHQLRTPIAVLKTLVQGAMFGQSDPAEALPRMLSVIDRSAGLTNQLLAIAKTEQLVRRADWHDVSLAEAVRGVAVELAPLMAAKRLDFSLHAVEVSIRSDGWLIGQLVRNLLANAIHHSPHGGRVGIVVRQWRDDAELIVWDHGEGVDENVLARLFEPFNVAEGSPGIGLGLSICRQIADSMNASVHLYNRIEGGMTVGVDAMVRWTAAARHLQDGPSPGQAGG